MRRKLFAVVIGSALVLGMFAGCGKQEAPVKSETSAVEQEISAEPEVPALKTIGEESADSYHVELTNSTGQNIISVAIYDSVSDEYTDNLLEDGDPFIAQETRILYCPKVEEETDVAEDNPEEKLITTEYNVEIQLEDESTYVLHAFPFEAMDKGDVLVEDDVAYVTYGEYTTKEAEIAIKEAEEQEKAEEEAAAEAQHKKQQSSKKSSYSDSGDNYEPENADSGDTYSEPEESNSDDTYSEPEESNSGDTYSEPEESYSEPANVDQDSESCIGDDGLTY